MVERMMLGRNLAKSATHGAGSLIHGAGSLIGGTEPVHAQHTTTIAAPEADVQAFLQNAGAISDVAGPLANVEETSPGEFVCTFTPAGGGHFTVTTRLVTDPGSLVWTQTDNASDFAFPQSAQATLTPNADDTQTQVTVDLITHPHAGVPPSVTSVVLGTALAKALQTAKAKIES
jgi:hypothetical protein